MKVLGLQALGLRVLSLQALRWLGRGKARTARWADARQIPASAMRWTMTACESGAAARWLFAMLATGTAPVLCGSIKSSTRACGAVSSARASAIDLRTLMLCCGETASAATADAESDAAGVDEILRRGARGLVLRFADVPAIALGGVIGPVIPMAARRERPFWTRQAGVRRFGAVLLVRRCSPWRHPAQRRRNWFQPEYWRRPPRRISLNGLTCASPMLRDPSRLNFSLKTWVVMGRNSGADRA